MKLFDDIHRTDETPMRNAESQYPFLNRSARPGMDSVRALLEDWLTRYPYPHRHELVSRFRSERDSQHHAAFFELLLHQYLLCLGCRVSVHPDTGSPKHPDFRVEAPDGTAFYMEAVVATGISETDASRRRVLHTVYDLLNTIESPNFWLCLVSVKQGQGPPPTRKMRRDLVRRLSETDPDEVLLSGGMTPVWRFEEGDWVWAIQAIPKSIEARGQTGKRPVGAYPIRGGFVQPERAVRDALIEKASRYGVMNRPYVIAVNGIDEFLEEEDIVEALFGSECVYVRPDVSGTEPIYSREPNGLWNTPPAPSHTRVSAVLSFINVSPWNITRKTPQLYHHPFAALPLEESALNVTQANVTGGWLVWRPGEALGPLFELPEEWPRCQAPPHEQRLKGERQGTNQADAI